MYSQTGKQVITYCPKYQEVNAIRQQIRSVNRIEPEKYFSGNVSLEMIKRAAWKIQRHVIKKPGYGKKPFA